MATIKNLENNEDLLDRPITELTVRQLLDAIPALKRKRIDGLRGLADYLGVALPTAQRLKNRQSFPAYEAGKRVYFYSDEVDNALKVKPIKRR